ncbi:MAG TPA: hypothetical protein VKT18_05625, partial [Acidimicrobiales bacterium]|nr:hypothetical protein [Acidimicrobiales bacterium]
MLGEFVIAYNVPARSGSTLENDRAAVVPAASVAVAQLAPRPDEWRGWDISIRGRMCVVVPD